MSLSNNFTCQKDECELHTGPKGCAAIGYRSAARSFFKALHPVPEGIETRAEP